MSEVPVHHVPIRPMSNHNYPGCHDGAKSETIVACWELVSNVGGETQTDDVKVTSHVAWKETVHGITHIRLASMKLGDFVCRNVVHFISVRANEWARVYI